MCTPPTTLDNTSSAIPGTTIPIDAATTTATTISQKITSVAQPNTSLKNSSGSLQEPCMLRLSNHTNAKYFIGICLQVSHQAGPLQRVDCLATMEKKSVKCLGHSDVLQDRKSNPGPALFRSLARSSTTELSPFFRCFYIELAFLQDYCYFDKKDHSGFCYKFDCYFGKIIITTTTFATNLPLFFMRSRAVQSLGLQLTNVPYFSIQSCFTSLIKL